MSVHKRLDTCTCDTLFWTALACLGRWGPYIGDGGGGGCNRYAICIYMIAGAARGVDVASWGVATAVKRVPSPRSL